MRRMTAAPLLFCLVAWGCDNDDVLVPGTAPAAPVGLQVSYWAGVVTVSWEIGSGWNQEPFRVYAKRSTDPDFFFIAEVTSCLNGVCSYHDNNVLADVTYQYYVSAIDPDTGLETASANVVEVFVPQPTPPPVPDALEVIALDDAIYLKWSDVARTASDFSFYRVYLDAGGGTEFFLGETDSEGYLDLVALNGETYTYFVTSVDDQGHESDASLTASGTPRPDYHGEWLYAFGDQPATSGFRFQADETADPIVDGSSPDRHFRLEVDANGWWLVPGPEAYIHPTTYATTALKCGVAADVNCVDVQTAPTSGYLQQDAALFTQTSYVLRVIGDDGLAHYGVIRVELLGFDQNDDAIMIFDWAYQLQPDNPALVTRGVDDDAVRMKR